MKSFQTSSFQNTFHRLIAGAKVAPTATHWKVCDVAWSRERHSYGGEAYRFQVEVHRLATSVPHHSWQLMVVVERWWSGAQEDLIRSTYWTKLVSGKRVDALAWFRNRSKEFDGRG